MTEATEDKRKADFRERYRTEQRRWVLWLALANAGGLTAVTTRITDDLKAAPAYLLLPSAWLFVIGLFAIALTAWTRQRRSHVSFIHHWDQPAWYSERILRWAKQEDVAEFTSAAACAAAVLWPLGHITLRVWGVVT